MCGLKVPVSPDCSSERLTQMGNRPFTRRYSLEHIIFSCLNKGYISGAAGQAGLIREAFASLAL